MQSMIVIIILCLCLSNNSATNLNRIKRALLFQRTSVLQFTYGLSVPFILPSRVINLSLCTQVNYDLPWSLNLLQPKIIQAKSKDDFDISRETFYRYIISFLEGMGLDGEQCLLRSVCEISEYPLHLEHKENLLEKIVHFIFTPSVDGTSNLNSSSLNVKLLEAENLGKNNGKCNNRFSGCAIPIVDIFTSKYII